MLLAEDRDVQKAILETLYVAPLGTDTHGYCYAIADMDVWAKRSGYDYQQVAGNLKALVQQELIIQQFIDKNAFMLTFEGMVYVEERRLISVDLLARNRQVRFLILDYLTLRYEQTGMLTGMTEVRNLLKHVDIDEGEFWRNISFLEKQGYVQRNPMVPSAWMYEVTKEGRHEVRQWRQCLEWAQRFEELKTSTSVSPQRRGHQLEELLHHVLTVGGWECERNVHAPGEEHDLLLHSQREYFLMECKWEKEKIQPTRLREFYGRLTERIGCHGLFLSMSGFTEEAKKNAAFRLDTCMILLFGPRDVETIFNSAFTDLLDKKVNAATTKRQILLDGEIVNR